MVAQGKFSLRSESKKRRLHPTFAWRMLPVLPYKTDYLAMRTWILILATLLIGGRSQQAQALIAYDDASNYGGGWSALVNNNQGFGFGPWLFSGTANPPTTYAGAFIGDPTAAGITGMGNQAFGLYANPSTETNGPSIWVFRSFADPLEVGNSFSFQWGLNSDSGGTGSKGFTLFALIGEGTWLSFMGVRQGGAPGIIELNAPDAAGWTNTGIAFGTGPMTWTVSQQSTTSFTITSTARDGSMTPVYTGNFTSTRKIGAVSFWATNLVQGDQHQPYFNNLKIVPEPSTYALLLMTGAGALWWARRRR